MRQIMSSYTANGNTRLKWRGESVTTIRRPQSEKRTTKHAIMTNFHVDQVTYEEIFAEGVFYAKLWRDHTNVK